MTGPTKKVTVFCGSRTGTNPVIEAEAAKLGKLMAERNWGLVYGGGTVGIMGTLARATRSNGGYVHGVIPKALISKEQAKEDDYDGATVDSGVPDPELYGETTVVTDMHTRKRLMGQEADAFVALPGGYGTIEEVFEAITWSQLGIHACPVVILNVDGFYDGILQYVKTAIATGFITPANGKLLLIAKTAEECLEKIDNFIVPEGRYNLNWSDQTPTKH